MVGYWGNHANILLLKPDGSMVALHGSPSGYASSYDNFPQRETVSGLTLFVVVVIPSYGCDPTIRRVGVSLVVLLRTARSL